MSVHSRIYFRSLENLIRDTPTLLYYTYYTMLSVSSEWLKGNTYFSNFYSIQPILS